MKEMQKELVTHLTHWLLLSCGVDVFVSVDGIPKVSNVLTLKQAPKIQALYGDRS